MATLTVSGTPPQGLVGSAYSFTPTVSSNSGGLVFALSGSLPPGLSFDMSAGTVSGTPTAAVSDTGLVISVTDSAGDTGSETIAITVITPINITLDGVPKGRLTDSYNYTFAVLGGSGTQSWSISQGSLPSGLSLNANTGTITGTPSAAGSSTFTVSVTDSTGTSTDTVTLVVMPTLSASLSVTELEVNQLRILVAAVNNSVGAVTWSITSGTLPAGLTLNAQLGEILGTPTAAGSFPITLKATDSTQSASVSVTLIVATGVALYADPPGAVVSTAYTYTPTLSGGVGPYTYALYGGNFPPGLVLNTTTGAITGVPLYLGSYTFGILVTDTLGGAMSETVVITVTQGAVYASDLVINTYLNAISTAAQTAASIGDWNVVAPSLVTVTGTLNNNPSLEALEAYWMLHDTCQVPFASPLVMQALNNLVDVRSSQKTAAVFNLFHAAVTAPSSVTSVDTFLRNVPNQRIVSFVEQKLSRILG